MPKSLQSLLTVVACPACHGTLSQDGSQLRCAACQAAYSFDRGVPRLLTAARAAELDARVAGFTNPHPALRKNALARALIPPSPVYDPFEGSRHARIRDLTRDGVVLNLGSKAADWGAHVVNVDLMLPAQHSAEQPSVDILADIERLPFADATADAIICTNVLEHVGSAHDCVLEIKRVLKPGGLVYISVPFIFPTHPDPLDRRRWTREGLQAEFGGFIEIESGAAGGPFSAYVSITPTLLGSVFSSFVLYNAVRFAFGWLLWPFKFLDVVAARSRHADRTASNVFFLGRKP